MVQDRNEIAESQGSDSSHFPVWKAVIAGWVLVNVPVLIIMLSVFLIGLALVPNLWWVSLSIAFFLGWTWWSFTVPRWRHWALKRGANPDNLQRWAVITGLVWRKGWIFEKTELPHKTLDVVTFSNSSRVNSRKAQTRAIPKRFLIT